MAFDPICKMEVNPETAQWESSYMGKTYYFCAPGCKTIFDQDPRAYIGGGTYSGGGCACCGGH
jgi:YHS domain-containing protein